MVVCPWAAAGADTPAEVVTLHMAAGPIAVGVDTLNGDITTASPTWNS
jgi:hypothetical protein